MSYGRGYLPVCAITGVITDIFPPAKRGFAMGLLSLLPLAAPVGMLLLNLKIPLIYTLMCLEGLCIFMMIIILKL